MQKIVYALSCLFSLLLASSSAFGQLSVDLQLLNPQAQVFPVGDLNFIESGLSQDYFVATLTNTSADDIPVILNFSILLNDVAIATARSAQFDMLPGSFMFTSIQLSEGLAFVGTQAIDMGSYTVQWDIVTNLEDQILATGSLPAGVYRFDLALERVDTGATINDDQPDDNELAISNPTTLELIFPGQSVSNPDITELATLFPYFQWATDVSTQSGQYDVYVYKKHVHDQTTQDVLNHPPILQIENLSEKYFQYPTTSAADLLSGALVGPVRPLESGHTYYWYVASTLHNATGGTEQLQSDVFRFKVVDLTVAAANTEQITAFLEQLLGDEHVGVLNSLREQGYEPEGTITINGRQVDLTELLELVNKVFGRTATVTSAEVY